ncbi:MAG: DUF1285 domain-containing protein [Pseudomonadota bacterium]
MSDANHTAATPSADAIATAVRAAAPRGLPPVDKWNPPFCGDIDMRIARDGTWFYNGSPIGRKPLVKLFSSVLKREDGKFFLVTPVEKLGIMVDDAPFVALDFEVTGNGRAQIITFETHVGDHAVAGEENTLRVSFDAVTGEPSPYIHIRRGLEALIDRKSFYRLVDMAEVASVDGTDWLGVWSAGVFFPFMRAEELEAQT